MLKKQLYILLSILFAQLAGHAQTVGGNWYGVGIVKRAGEESNYLSELTLIQTGNKVTGEFSYYFRSIQVKTTVIGKFNPNSRFLELFATPIVNHQAKDNNAADCPMEGSFTLIVAKVQSTLTGWFNPTEDYKYTCRPIYIKFVKDLTDYSQKLIPTFKTVPSDTAVKQAPPPPPLPPPPPQLTPKQLEEKKRIADLSRRTFEPTPIIDVEADSIKIDLYDNGEIDNDTVSLFLNRKPIVVKQMLTATAFTITLAVDSSVNELSMFAENLGKIPPNTAVAVIYADGKRSELYLTSNYIKNATLRFRKKVKDPKNVN